MTGPTAYSARPSACPALAAAAEQKSLGLRPPTRTNGADAEWRNAHRARVEKEATRNETEPEHLLETVVLLARAPLFRSCSAEELRALAATAYPMSFEPGESLCREGGESLECYVIAEGEATVTIGGRAVRSVGEDDVVGERGVLEARPRTASVKATTHMNTWAISRERLLALLAERPSVKAAMMDHVQRRYRDGERMTSQ